MLTKLKTVLAERGLTQKDLSERTGIALAAISRYANGKGNPTVKSVLAIADELGCTISDLIEEAYADEEDTPGERRWISDEERYVLEAYRMLSEDERSRVEAVFFKAVSRARDLDKLKSMASREDAWGEDRWSKGKIVSMIMEVHLESEMIEWEREFDDDDIMLIVTDVLRTVGPAERIMLSLRYASEKSDEQIASQLGSSKDLVKIKIEEAIAQIVALVKIEVNTRRELSRIRGEKRRLSDKSGDDAGA